MNQTQTILNAIVEFILGKRYYANVINTRGTGKQELSCFIFRSKADADRHRADLSTNGSYSWVETVSFRSRNEY